MVSWASAITGSIRVTLQASAADIYAYIVLSWTGFLGMTLSAPAQAYFDGIKADERVAKAQSVLAAAK